MSNPPPRKSPSRSNLNMSVTSMPKPFASTDPPPPIPKEDQELMAQVEAAEEMLKSGKPMQSAALGRLLAKCTLALTRWHGRWDPETKEPKWYTGGNSGGIDPAKMVAVWEVQNELMTDMLATIEKNDESNAAQALDNEATRRAVEQMMHSSQLNRWISGFTTVVMIACMLLIAGWSRDTLRTAQKAKELLSASLNATSLDHEARVAKSRAEDNLDFAALEEVEKKELKAEAALAQVQAVVAATPKVREQAKLRLRSVKKRAKKMRVHIEDLPQSED